MAEDDVCPLLLPELLLPVVGTVRNDARIVTCRDLRLTQPDKPSSDHEYRTIHDPGFGDIAGGPYRESGSRAIATASGFDAGTDRAPTAYVGRPAAVAS